MPVDDAELTRRLAALEAEVKADSDAQRARKDAAMAKVREQQAQKQAEREELSQRQAEVVRKKDRGSIDGRDQSPPGSAAERRRGSIDDALVLAKGAQIAAQAKAELGRPREKGEKSWIASSLLSLVFGPVGWLYAGSFREAIPAGAIYVLLAAILSKLPMFLVWPVMMVALPLSAIAGLVYAIQFNRKGKRTRIFDKAGDAKKKLPPATPPRSRRA